MKHKALKIALPIVALSGLTATGFSLFVLNNREQPIEDTGMDLNLQSIFQNKDITLNVNNQYGDLKKVSLLETSGVTYPATSTDPITFSSELDPSTLPLSNQFGFNFSMDISAYADDSGVRSEISWVDLASTGSSGYSKLPKKGDVVFEIDNLYITLKLTSYDGYLDYLDFRVDQLTKGPYENDQDKLHYVIPTDSSTVGSNEEQVKISGWASTSGSSLKECSVKIPLNFGLYNDYEKDPNNPVIDSNGDYNIDNSKHRYLSKKVDKVDGSNDDGNALLSSLSSRKENLVDQYNSSSFIKLDKDKDGQESGTKVTSVVNGFLGGFSIARKENIKHGDADSNGKDDFDEFIDKLNTQATAKHLSDRKLTVSISSIDLRYRKVDFSTTTGGQSIENLGYGNFKTWSNTSYVGKSAPTSGDLSGIYEYNIFPGKTGDDSGSTML